MLLVFVAVSEVVHPEAGLCLSFSADDHSGNRCHDPLWCCYNLSFSFQPVEDRRRVRAILPYTKVPETDEIRYKNILKPHPVSHFRIQTVFCMFEGGKFKS